MGVRQIRLAAPVCKTVLDERGHVSSNLTAPTDGLTGIFRYAAQLAGASACGAEEVGSNPTYLI